MDSQQSSERSALTIEDLADSGWEQAISESKHEGYVGISSALAAAAKRVSDKNKATAAKVLRLLADACSMMLKPERTNDPYTPSIILAGKRSAIPDDFSPEDIDFFKEVVEQIENAWLRGRLADVIWLVSSPREAKYALLAIDAYRELGLDCKTWKAGSRECWDRAIRLAITLGKGAGVRIMEMRDALVAAFNNTTVEDKYLGFWLSGLLDEHRLARDNSKLIAEHLAALAQQFKENKDHRLSRDYFDAASVWYSHAEENVKCVEMTVEVAESWASEAAARTSAGKPGHIFAAEFYENAIQVYRRIPRKWRAPHRVDERMDELRALLSETGEKAAGELGSITTEGIDISDLIKHAQSEVAGKGPEEALVGFANLHRTNVKTLREETNELIQNHPMRSLFSSVFMSADGRVIAKHPGRTLHDFEEDAIDPALWAQMIHNYGISIGLAVQGCILPALRVLASEHRFQERDFAGLCMRSPIVPKDRVRLWGKALHLGFEGDFLSAIHILCPQIEHMVRVHLRSAGVKTTTLDHAGIETENGLSTLMKQPEADRVLGEDLGFEIRALFCESMGPNLRNEVAHGLISFESCYSTYSIYAWWLAIRLTFNTYWNAHHRSGKGQSEEAAE